MHKSLADRSFTHLRGQTPSGPAGPALFLSASDQENSQQADDLQLVFGLTNSMPLPSHGVVQVSQAVSHAAILLVSEEELVRACLVQCGGPDLADLEQVSSSRSRVVNPGMLVRIIVIQVACSNLTLLITPNGVGSDLVRTTFG